MNTVYKSLEISKQSFFQHKQRQQLVLEERQQILLLVLEVRKDHPTMGARDMYYKLQPSCIGRDVFELLCKQEGFVSPQSKNYRRTTDSTGVVRFENKIEELEITRVDQVWQSDITYYEVNRRFFYLTFIIDAYSRMIVGYSVSDSLLTINTTVPALKKALILRNRVKGSLAELIFHSDGGGQYYAKTFIELTSAYNITNSMCEYAWENGKAERINGVIKNNYLRHKTIKSFHDLEREVDRSVYLYNFEKPHIKLHRKTPFEYEKKVYQKIQNSIQSQNAKVTQYELL